MAGLCVLKCHEQISLLADKTVDIKKGIAPIYSDTDSGLGVQQRQVI